MTDESDWEAAIVATVEHLGGLDILVNNAGIEITALVTEIAAEDARRMLEVNVLGTTLGLKHGLRAMRPGGAAGQGGAIVNIASVAATIAFPASRCIRRRSPPSTNSRAWRRWSRASSVMASGSTASIGTRPHGDGRRAGQ